MDSALPRFVEAAAWFGPFNGKTGLVAPCGGFSSLWLLVGVFVDTRKPKWPKNTLMVVFFGVARFGGGVQFPRGRLVAQTSGHLWAPQAPGTSGRLRANPLSLDTFQNPLVEKMIPAAVKKAFFFASIFPRGAPPGTFPKPFFFETPF